MARAGASRGGAAEVDRLAEGVLAQDVRSLARAISLVEDGGEAAPALIGRLYPRAGRARVVGITGPPGAGKSTLADRLARAFRERGETVGILAIDPTSPFSGGAVLGDRIRMQSLYTDPGVFIRSMATRGAVGGLAAAAHDAVDLLDAAGYAWVLLETVGVGQDEVDVVRSVDTVLLVTLPGLGDDIQAIKAGILEIADVFVINKADREGADRTARDLEMMLGLAEGTAWRPPIVKTVASRSERLPAVVEAVEAHRRWLEEAGGLSERRRAHLRQRVEAILERRVVTAADRLLGLERQLDRAFAERTDPYRVADGLFNALVGEGAKS